MANIFDVARYILEAKGPMTMTKLQKLCYYAQAWAMVWNDEELFSEDFEAWWSGPVSPVLDEWHSRKEIVCVNDIPTEYLSCEDPLSAKQKESLDIVLRKYGDYSEDILSGFTHREAPWYVPRGDLAPGKHCTKVITKESMYMYYDVRITA